MAINAKGSVIGPNGSTSMKTSKTIPMTVEPNPIP